MPPRCNGFTRVTGGSSKEEKKRETPLSYVKKSKIVHMLFIATNVLLCKVKMYHYSTCEKSPHELAHGRDVWGCGIFPVTSVTFVIKYKWAV